MVALMGADINVDGVRPRLGRPTLNIESGHPDIPDLSVGKANPWEQHKQAGTGERMRLLEQSHSGSDPDRVPPRSPDSEESPERSAIESPSGNPWDRISDDKTAEHRRYIVNAVAGRYGVDSDDDIATVATAFDATRAHLAPAIAHGIDRILHRCREFLVDHPEATIAFVGCAGQSMALAAQALDPELFDRHCAVVTISRIAAEAAVQDLELYSGKTFPELEGFRGARSDVDPDTIAQSRARMADMLESNGLPVQTPGADIVVVDVGFRGNIQELLSASFPTINFRGFYLFHGEVSKDPHPYSKAGVLLHLAADGAVVSHDPSMPSDLAVSMAEDYASAVEQALQVPCPKTGDTSIRGTSMQHLESPPLNRFNPFDVSPAYVKKAVQLAVMDINQLAVADYAQSVAARRRAGQDTAHYLAADAAASLRQLGWWTVGERSAIDTEFATMMNSIAQVSAKHIGTVTDTIVEHREVDPRTAIDIWTRFQNLTSREPASVTRIDSGLQRLFLALGPPPDGLPTTDGVRGGTDD